MSAAKIAKVEAKLAANLKALDDAMLDGLFKPHELKEQISERYSLLHKLKKIQELEKTKIAPEAPKTASETRELLDKLLARVAASRQDLNDQAAQEDGLQWQIAHAKGQPRNAGSWAADDSEWEAVVEANSIPKAQQGRWRMDALVKKLSAEELANRVDAEEAEAKAVARCCLGRCGVAAKVPATAALAQPPAPCPPAKDVSKPSEPKKTKIKPRPGKARASQPMAVSLPIDYQFRAECQNDVDEFKALLSEDDQERLTMFPDPMLPDVDCELSSYLSLDELRKLMGQITDSHVMVESLNLASAYTGDRWFQDW